MLRRRREQQQQPPPPPPTHHCRYAHRRRKRNRSRAMRCPAWAMRSLAYVRINASNWPPPGPVCCRRGTAPRRTASRRCCWPCTERGHRCCMWSSRPRQRTRILRILILILILILVVVLLSKNWPPSLLGFTRILISGRVKYRKNDRPTTAAATTTTTKKKRTTMIVMAMTMTVIILIRAMSLMLHFLPHGGRSTKMNM